MTAGFSATHWQGDAHTTQRSKGRRRYQVCDLQSDQKWPAPGL